MPADNETEISNDEIAKRRDAALLRALSTPHKKQADMKVGKAPKPKSTRKPAKPNERA